MRKLDAEIKLAKKGAEKISNRKKSSPGWVDAWMGVKAILRIAYSNKKFLSGALHSLKR